jgi:hypothetical protein
VRLRNLILGTGITVVALAASAAAGATTLDLSCELLSTGTNPSCPATAPTYAVPGQYNYGNSFNAPTGTTAIAGSDINGASAGFIDDYFINIAPAQVDALTATVSIDGDYLINNLFARIYQLSTNPDGLVTADPVGTVFNGVVSGNGTSTTVQIGSATAPIDLASGQYVLEVSGTTAGDLGGQYFGGINLMPVPLPPALPLLLCGIGVLAVTSRLRRGAAA